MGVVLGVVAGVFAMAIQAIAAYVAREVDISNFTRYVSTAIGFLIIGGAARRLAAEWKSTTPGWQVGALIGGVSEAIGAVGGAVILAFSPVGQAAFSHLSVREQQASQDPGFVIAALAAEVGTMVLFGALVGWLAAWSVVRFSGPNRPQGPRNGQVK